MQSPDKRQLKVNLSDLETGFDNSTWELAYHLDLETGEVVLVTDEVRSDLELIYNEIEDVDDTERSSAFHEALARSALPEWEREAVLEADQIEESGSSRYLQLPRFDSRAGYRDMEDFIETVQRERLQTRLRRAIDGRGAFRRFNDELFANPDEEQRWYAFRDARLRQRVLDWLDEEGIEPIME